MRKRRFVVKRRDKTVSRIALLLGALLLIAGFIWGVFSLINGAGRRRRPMELPFGPEANYAYTGTGFLYFGGGKLCYVDIGDSGKNASYSVNTQELKLAASEEVSALYNESAVQIVGGAEPLVFSGRVLKVKCGGGYTAVLTEDDAGAAVTVYDRAAAQADRMEFSAEGLVDFGFSGADPNTLWTLETDYSSQLPAATLTTYNLSTKRTTGVMAVRGQLVSDVIFTGSSLFLSATGSLMRYNLSGGSEAYRVAVYGWELMDYTLKGSCPLLMYRGRGEDPPATIKLYSLPEGDVGSAAIAMVHPPEGCLGMFLANGRLIAYTADEAVTYSAQGRLMSREKLPMKVEKVRKLSDSHILLQSGGRLYLEVTG